MSRSPSSTVPPAIRRPRRAWPSMARPTVVLPDPDSPTTPKISPRAIPNDTSLMTGVPVDSIATCRSWTAAADTAGPAACPPRPALRARRRSCFARGPAEARRGPRDAVADQAGSQRQQRDDDDRRGRPPGLDHQHDLVLLDHGAPVRAVGIGGEPEERQPGDQG